MREIRILAAMTVVAVFISGIAPFDRRVWAMELLATSITVPTVVAIAPRFPLTPLVWRLGFFGVLLMVIGAHYTYARVPLGFWMERWFGLTRNDYDRVGHFFQGVVVALIVRELLLRRTAIKRGTGLFVIVALMALGVSAAHEIVEWWGARTALRSVTDYLGEQGDIWDTQWDMFLGLCGAIVAQIVLARRHDRQIERLRSEDAGAWR